MTMVVGVGLVVAGTVALVGSGGAGGLTIVAGVVVAVLGLRAYLGGLVEARRRDDDS